MADLAAVAALARVGSGFLRRDLNLEFALSYRLAALVEVNALIG